MVFVTTPPQPASNARMMLESDSVGGAEASRNGFSNRRPVKTVDRSAHMGPPSLIEGEECTTAEGLLQTVAGGRWPVAGCRLPVAGEAYRKMQPAGSCCSRRTPSAPGH